MAKRSHNKKAISAIPAAENEQVVVLQTAELIKRAVDKSSPAIYANHAQFFLSGNEIYIDFYRFEPAPDLSSPHNSTFLQRVIVPSGLGKGIVTGMANMIAGFEKDSGQIIPNLRAPTPGDSIKIWE